MSDYSFSTQNTVLIGEETFNILSRRYWKEAAKQSENLRMLVFAALIVAMRVAVKFFKVPLTAGLNITLDCYVNSLGSLVYGPVMALCVGAISDTIGCIVAPSGPYFLPFILVEMSSSFIFALFFWRKKITVSRILSAKFTVNLICNIMLTSLFVKWSYYFYYGVEKAEAYNLINGVRIVKNLILFPLESLFITLVFEAAVPLLERTKILPKGSFEMNLPPKKRTLILSAIALTLLSVTIILSYRFFLSDFVKKHNIKFL